MPLNLTKETLWQEDQNAIWYSNEKPTCDLCGKKTDLVIEFKINEEDDGTRACMSSKRDCIRLATNLLFAQNPDVEYLWSREIEYKPTSGKSKKKNLKKREPIGLSKRYTIMKRDGFQCVLCGASGKDSQLEIDHIIPVAAGGTEAMTNLRTLCFKCNRGKSDKIE